MAISFWNRASNSSGELPSRVVFRASEISDLRKSDISLHFEIRVRFTLAMILLPAILP
jgi:hypothetical protein